MFVVLGKEHMACSCICSHPLFLRNFYLKSFIREPSYKIYLHWSHLTTIAVLSIQFVQRSFWIVSAMKILPTIYALQVWGRTPKWCLISLSVLRRKSEILSVPTAKLICEGSSTRTGGSRIFHLWAITALVTGLPLAAKSPQKPQLATLIIGLSCEGRNGTPATNSLYYDTSSDTICFYGPVTKPVDIVFSSA